MSNSTIDTRIQEFKLRFAVPEDTRVILGFIKELAEYESLSCEVVADEEILKNSLFERNVAEVIIGEYDERPVGFAVFFHNFSTFLGRPGIYIEDLYIQPEKRGKGLGKVMLSFLAKLTKERNCGRLEWSCLDWNLPSINFYKKLGAKPMDDWTSYRITAKELDELANYFGK